MHFFNPVHRMPLVEVIRGSKTSDQTVATTVALAKRLGKIPVVVQDSPGFLVNRILMPFMNEAGMLVEEGYDFSLIDQALVDFGFPMGAFELLDNVGIDVAAKVSLIFKEEFGERIPGANVLDVWARRVAGGSIRSRARRSGWSIRPFSGCCRESPARVACRIRPR